MAYFSLSYFNISICFHTLTIFYHSCSSTPCHASFVSLFCFSFPHFLSLLPSTDVLCSTILPLLTYFSNSFHFLSWPPFLNLLLFFTFRFQHLPFTLHFFLSFTSLISFYFHFFVHLLPYYIFPILHFPPFFALALHLVVVSYL